MKNSKPGSTCMGPIILYTLGQNRVNFHEKKNRFEIGLIESLNEFQKSWENYTWSKTFMKDMDLNLV